MTGSCPLKVAGAEYCMLCGLAHYGHARNCPHIGSVTQLRLMVDALKQSPEQADLIDLAKKKAVGIIGSLNQDKRKKEQRQRERLQQAGTVTPRQPPLMNEGEAVHHPANMVQPSVSMRGPTAEMLPTR